MFLQNDAYATIRSSMSLEKHPEWAPVFHPSAPNPACLPCQVGAASLPQVDPFCCPKVLDFFFLVVILPIPSVFLIFKTFSASSAFSLPPILLLSLSFPILQFLPHPCMYLWSLQRESKDKIGSFPPHLIFFPLVLREVRMIRDVSGNGHCSAVWVLQQGSLVRAVRKWWLERY